MKQLYIDCTNGISGDMMLNALKGVGADETYIALQLQQLDLDLEERPADRAEHHGDHGDHGEETHHSHSHRSYKEIKEKINGSGMGQKVKDTALAIYQVIAKGEAKVHGTEMEDVHFHEVGRDRAIANIVGIAAALDDLRVKDIYCSEIHDGKGFIECSHGTIPVPVPAVMAIRENCDYRFVIDEEVNTEMVTPSGLGILAGIGAKAADAMPEGQIIKTAEGKGSRDTGRGGLKVTLMRTTDEKAKQPQPIKNDELLASIRKAKEEPGQENTVAMLNQVVRAKLIAPISLDKEPIVSDPEGPVELEKDTQISFEMIAASTGDLYYPVFTHGAEMKKCSKEKDQHSLLVNFEDLANMVLNQRQAVKGFVINPMGENICFNTDMIESMMNEIKGK